jgi:PAS domain S-box-containing protein
MKASSPALMPRTERPPRLVLRFAVYTGCVLLLAGLAMLFILERDITSGAEQRVESQSRAVAEATFKQHLTRTDFVRPVSAKRRAKLDMVFQDRVFLAGVVQATLYDADRRVTYSTNHSLIGRTRPSDTLESALKGRPDRSVRVLDIAGERTKVLHTTVPVRSGSATAPIGALSLAQDYRTIDLEIREAFQHAAAILGLALLVLWISLIPLLRRTTNQLRARNQQLADQSRDVAQLAAIVEASDDAITRTSSDGTVVTWNPGAERLFGWRADEIVGRKLAVVVPPDRLDELSSVARRIEAGEGVEDHETRALRKDETEVDVSLTASPILDDAGVVTGAAVISRDITHLKQQQAQLEATLAKERVARADAEGAQHALAEQNERLRELDRLKDEFIALVSHELRTPLTSIHGYLELVLDGGAGELGPEQQRFLSVVERNTKRLMQLVGDLLFMAQVEAGKLALDLEEVDLKEVLAECLEAAKPVADDRQVELVTDLAETPSMLGDRSRLAQVLDNLISNALKFTPADGRVSVRVSRTGRDAVVQVADTGVGIPAEEQDRLFERFFRSSNAMEQAIPGTGLGLTIAKTIVERHEGSIEIESAEGKGTTVRVRLPLGAAVSEDVAA